MEGLNCQTKGFDLYSLGNSKPPEILQEFLFPPLSLFPGTAVEVGKAPLSLPPSLPLPNRYLVLVCYLPGTRDTAANKTEFLLPWCLFGGKR